MSGRVISLMLENEGVVRCHAPQVGRELKEKKNLWSQLDEAMQSIHKRESVVNGADFNGHVEAGSRGGGGAMGRFDLKEWR